MNGSEDQVKKAERIKERINGEFDRLARALESSAAKQSGQDRLDTEAVIVILEEKRADVMAKGQADYFINNWRELSQQVRNLIVQDSRYRDIDTRKAIRRR
jgi:hypothetical protein